MSRSLTTAQTQQNTGGQVPPFAAGKNKIINGAMDMSQRYGTTSTTSTYAGGVAWYTLDRFYYAAALASKCSVQQVADAPSGLSNSAKITSLAATTPGTSDYYYYAQSIEGYNFKQFGFGTSAASTITLSFYVKSSLTGTFSVLVCNGAYTRNYVSTYTINSANTWERKTITITGDITGTWTSDNTAGAVVLWDLGAGSTYTTSSTNTWGTTYYQHATGSTNFVANNAATWQITGVQLEAGSVATPFTTASGSIGGELALCQRYYYRACNGADSGFPFLGMGQAYSTTAAYVIVNLPATMRTVPSLVSSGIANFQITTSTYGVVSGTAFVLDTASVRNATVAITGASGLTAGNGAGIRAIGSTSNTYVDFNAEL